MDRTKGGGALLDYFDYPWLDGFGDVKVEMKSGKEAKSSRRTQLFGIDKMTEETLKYFPSNSSLNEILNFGDELFSIPVEHKIIIDFLQNGKS